MLEYAIISARIMLKLESLNCQQNFQNPFSRPFGNFLSLFLESEFASFDKISKMQFQDFRFMCNFREQFFGVFVFFDFAGSSASCDSLSFFYRKWCEIWFFCFIFFQEKSLLRLKFTFYAV